MSRLQVVLAVFVLGVNVSAAEASPLPPYSVVGDLLFNTSPPDRIFPNDFGSFSLNGGSGSVSLGAAGVPSPSLLAEATVESDLVPSIFGRADALLTYAMEIVGPSGLVPVVIDVSGFASGFSDAGGSFAVETRWNLFDGSVALAGDDIRSGQLSGSFSQGFNRTIDLMLASNQLYTVFMLADAAAAASIEGSQATARAFIDPIFSFGAGVDPQYAFAFSDGIGNTAPTAVPEPGTLALTSTSLLVAGCWCRRRARQPPVA
jgi:hypothetical protein